MVGIMGRTGSGRFVMARLGPVLRVDGAPRIATVNVERTLHRLFSSLHHRLVSIRRSARSLPQIRLLQDSIPTARAL